MPSATPLRTPAVAAVATVVAALVAWAVAADAPGGVGVAAVLAVAAAGVGAVLASASTARTERERERQAFLGEASTMLLACPDRAAAATTSAALAVPLLAGWCAIDVVAEDGVAHRRAVRHSEPALAEAGAHLDAETGVGETLRTGRSQLWPHVAELGDAAALFLPLRTVERSVGVMTLVSRAPEGFGEDEIALAGDLARRCSAAIANTPAAQDAAAASTRFRRATPAPRAAADDPDGAAG